MCRGAGRCTGPTPTRTFSTTRSGPTRMSRPIGPTPMTTSTTASSFPTAHLTSITPIRARTTKAPTCAAPPARFVREHPAASIQATRAFCAEQAKNVTDLPFARIEQAVRPINDQKALFADLRKAAADAAAQFRDACPDAVPLTPLGPAPSDDAAARRDSRGDQDHPPVARGVLPVAHRRAEGALQRDRAGSGSASRARPSSTTRRTAGAARPG